MGRASEPLLKWLRQAIERKGWNTAAVAAALEQPRSVVRRKISGAEPLTVDDLIVLADALGLEAEALQSFAAGQDTGARDRSDDAVVVDVSADRQEAPESLPRMAIAEEGAISSVPVLSEHAPVHNQPELLFRLAFEAGMDFLFVADTAQLQDSGLPPHVLATYRDKKKGVFHSISIKLDAAYHHHNKPRYTPHGVTVTLSFDGLYACEFPWSSFERVMFLPEVVEPSDDGSDDSDGSEDDPPTGGAPFLRLVT